MHLNKIVVVSQETGYINKSLLTLGHVIYKLSENNFEHIPYRDRFVHVINK